MAINSRASFTPQIRIDMPDVHPMDQITDFLRRKFHLQDAQIVTMTQSAEPGAHSMVSFKSMFSDGPTMESPYRRMLNVQFVGIMTNGAHIEMTLKADADSIQREIDIFNATPGSSEQNKIKALQLEVELLAGRLAESYKKNDQLEPLRKQINEFKLV